MKKNYPPFLLLAALLCWAGRPVRAQVSQSTDKVEYRINPNLNTNAMRIGLGNVYNCNDLCIHSYLGFNITPKPNEAKWVVGSDGGNNGGVLLLGGMSGDLLFATLPTSNPGAIREPSNLQIKNSITMALSNTGQLRVGLHTPTSQPDYKLAVEGKLVAQYIYVTQPNTWADFVFAPNYQLQPLPELAAYLRRHQHLPALPSAAEVAAEGYSVTDMDARLLQTIEELTLHVIELDKQVKALQAQAQVAAAR